MIGSMAIMLGGRNKMTIAIYYRVSTDTQSIDHQKHTINEWIKEKGYSKADIVEYIDEGISGKHGADKRPGFAALLEEIKSKKVRKVIFFEFSRASRDFMQFLQFLDLCSSYGCQVEVAGSGVQKFETSTDKLIASVQAFLSQAEREKISTRVKSGMAKAKASGTKLGPPTGNKNRLGKTKDYPENLLKIIRRKTAKGDSTREIAQDLNEMYPNSPITHVTVHNIQKRYDMKKTRRKKKAG